MNFFITYWTVCKVILTICIIGMFIFVGGPFSLFGSVRLLYYPVTFIFDKLKNKNITISYVISTMMFFVLFSIYVSVLYTVISYLINYTELMMRYI